jgi:hypothetical protein
MLHDAQVDKADDVFGVSLKATKCAKPELSVRELTKRWPVARPRKPIEHLSCIPAIRLASTSTLGLLPRRPPTEFSLRPTHSVPHRVHVHHSAAGAPRDTILGARLFGGYRFCAAQVVAFGFAVARVVATLGEKTDKATLSIQSPVVRFGISSGFAFARPVCRF